MIILIQLLFQFQNGQDKTRASHHPEDLFTEVFRNIFDLVVFQVFSIKTHYSIILGRKKSSGFINKKGESLYLAYEFRQITHYLAEQFRQITHYLAEQFHQTAHYLAEHLIQKNVILFNEKFLTLRMQVFKSMQICKYANKQLCKYANTQVYKYANL